MQSLPEPCKQSDSCGDRGLHHSSHDTTADSRRARTNPEVTQLTVPGASDSSWKPWCSRYSYTESVTVDTIGGKPDIGLTAGTQTVQCPVTPAAAVLDLLDFAWPSNGGAIRNASGTDTDLGHVGATRPCTISVMPNRTQEPAEEEPAGTETVSTAQIR